MESEVYMSNVGTREAPPNTGSATKTSGPTDRPRGRLGTWEFRKEAIEHGDQTG